MNIETFCKNCLVKACCLTDRYGYKAIEKPCEKIKELVLKEGETTWNRGEFTIPYSTYDSTGPILVVTDFDFDYWYEQRYGKEKNEKRLKKLQEVLDDCKTNKLQR